ncbi:MAG: hypothetical protein JO199_03060 [Candidatus Eremiobacteraeota bacterium]|nr:hypothetical protein [Candidatus Eremiobacteraeota bacterium]
MGGKTVAAAGAPEKIEIQDASAADIGDVYGFVDIYFEPLALSDGRSLPVRAPEARLAPRDSAGHESTVALEDLIEDAVIPYHVFYHMFRKGKNFVIGPGVELSARTGATMTALANGTVAIETPAPLPVESNAPTSSFPVEPIATPFGPSTDMGHGRKPSPLPTPSATPVPSPAPPASPSPSPTP